MISTTEEIREFARQCLSDSPGSHDWDHVERVHNLCMQIAAVEGADKRTLEIAAYLHDIGRPYEDASKGKICHAEKGAEMARSLLENYPLSQERKRNIIHCILTHRFRGNHRPESQEAKILFDADKLDAIGAIGVGRAFLFAGEVGARLHNAAVDPAHTEAYTQDDTGYREFKLKLSRIKDQMLTPEGRRIALERHAFMADFFKRFLEECNGSVRSR